MNLINVFTLDVKTPVLLVFWNNIELSFIGNMMSFPGANAQSSGPMFPGAPTSQSGPGPGPGPGGPPHFAGVGSNGGGGPGGFPGAWGGWGGWPPLVAQPPPNLQAAAVPNAG